MALFTRFNLILALFLIWLGAAVTTTDVGLSVPDWPSSYGYSNPPNWLHVPGIRLEHGHRKTAEALGLCVLAVFTAYWFAKSGLKLGALDQLLIAALGFVIAIDLASVVNDLGGGIDPEKFEKAVGHATRGLGGIFLLWFGQAVILKMWRKVEFGILVLALGLSVLLAFLVTAAREPDASTKIAAIGPFALPGLILLGLLLLLWWVHGCTQRAWTLALKIASLSLILVTVQAILGGLRVTKMSNAFAVVHGCLAQVFFCVLIFQAFLASEGWRNPRPLVQAALRSQLFKTATILTACIFIQLALGATIRHTHRITLAATDILTTGGKWIPNLKDHHLFLLFCHKAWGVITTIVLLWAALRVLAKSGQAHLCKLAGWLILVVSIQVALGVLTVSSNKGFWWTNLHVFNGLALLALAFSLALQIWRTGPRSGLLA